MKLLTEEDSYIIFLFSLHFFHILFSWKSVPVTFLSRISLVIVRRTFKFSVTHLAWLGLPSQANDCRLKRLQTGSSMWCAAVSLLSEEPVALVKTASWRMKLVGCFYFHTCKTLTMLAITGFSCVENLLFAFSHIFLSLRREQHLYLVWFRNSVFFWRPVSHFNPQTSILL